MIIKHSGEFTQKIFLFDLILNWTLGLALLFFPEVINRLTFKTALFGPMLYTLLGVLFLLFAFWQTGVHLLKKVFRPFNLAFAAVMAIIPIILLTQALLSFNSLIHPLILLLLWLGNTYMFLLTAWYLYAIFLFSYQNRRSKPGR